MNFISKTLSKGIELCFFRMERFKSVRICVNMAVPLCAQTAARYAVLPSMLTRLCDKYPDLTLMNRKLGELYGASVSADVTKLGDSQVLRFGISALDDKFALGGEKISMLCAELLCEMLIRPLLSDYSFRNEDVEREKRILLEALDAEESDKRTYARKRCLELMCEGDIYAVDRLGGRESIESLSADSVFEAWKTLIARSVIQINVVGNCDGEKIGEMISSALTSSLRQEPFTLSTEKFKGRQERREFTEKQKLSQSKLVLGYSMGLIGAEENLSAFRVMCDIFGGSPYSKLFMNVREKLSLCYYCSSSLLKEKGIMLVQSGILSKNKELALSEIQNQLSKMKNGDFTAEEIDASVKGITDDLSSVYDSPETLDDWLLLQMNKKEIKMPDDIAGEVREVTKEEIIEAARRISLDTVYFLAGEETDEDAGNN